MVGAVLSMRTVRDPTPELPSRSVAVVVGVVIPLAVMDAEAGFGPLVMPAPASVADHVTVVFVLFQPAAFGAGARTPVTIGPVLSSVYDAWPASLGPVHFPCELTLGDGAAVTARAPSPAPAVVVKVQEVFAVADDWVAIMDPLTSTHLVSLEVVTVSVRPAPLFAYRTPDTKTVPDPPENTAPLTLDANATGALSPAITNVRIGTSASHSRRRRPECDGNAGAMGRETGLRKEDKTLPSAGADSRRGEAPPVRYGASCPFERS